MSGWAFTAGTAVGLLVGSFLVILIAVRSDERDVERGYTIKQSRLFNLVEVKP